MTTETDNRVSAEPETASALPILTTKLGRPPIRDEHIARSDLVRRLHEGIARPLTLVTGPPGFGKTTLLAAWSADNTDRVAWLSLDDDDNDPARFFLYVVAALRTVEPGIGVRA